VMFRSTVAATQFSPARKGWETHAPKKKSTPGAKRQPLDGPSLSGGSAAARQSRMHDPNFIGELRLRDPRPLSPKRAQSMDLLSLCVFSAPLSRPVVLKGCYPT
jgi:hypothetical protein